MPGRKVDYGDVLGARDNNPERNSRWAFAEFTEVYQIKSDFEAEIEAEFSG